MLHQRHLDFKNNVGVILSTVAVSRGPKIRLPVSPLGLSQAVYLYFEGIQSFLELALRSAIVKVTSQ
jgi:hypothetical protein